MRSGAVLGVVPDAVGVEIDVGVRVWPTPVCGAGTARPRSVTRSARMVLLPIADAANFDAVADADFVEAGRSDEDLRRAVDRPAEAVVLRRNRVGIDRDLIAQRTVGRDDHPVRGRSACRQRCRRSIRGRLPAHRALVRQTVRSCPKAATAESAANAKIARNLFMETSCA